MDPESKAAALRQKLDQLKQQRNRLDHSIRLTEAELDLLDDQIAKEMERSL